VSIFSYKINTLGQTDNLSILHNKYNNIIIITKVITKKDA